MNKTITFDVNNAEHREIATDYLNNSLLSNNPSWNLKRAGYTTCPFKTSKPYFNMDVEIRTEMLKYLLKNSDSTGHYFEKTYDELGRILTYKDSDGGWFEYTRDENGNVLAYKDSDGDWREYTRDADGNVLTYKDSNG